MINYLVGVATNVAVFGILTLGVDVQWGWGGLLNLTYFTFVASGAYFTALFAMPAAVSGSGQTYAFGLGLPWGVAALLGVLATMVLAAIIGAIALKRLRTDYLAIVTLSVGYVIYQVIGQVGGIFNGQTGLYAIPSPWGTASWISSSAYPNFFLGVCVVALIAAVLVARRLHGSAFGLALRASRDSGPAAQAFGYDIFAVRLKAFIVGAAFAGAGGAFLGAYLTAFGPGAWAPTETFLLYVAVLIGGRGRPVGVLVGVLLVNGVLQEATRYLPNVPGHPDFIASLRLAIIGLLMILALRFRPQGVLPEKSWMDAPVPGSPTSTRRLRLRRPA